jgi:hypothetical protein
MAALDFPASPTVNQMFSAGNGMTYRWDGTHWIAVATTGGYLPLTGGTLTGPLIAPSAVLNGLTYGPVATSGFGGDGTNLALRAYAGASKIYFQNASGANYLGSVGTSNWDIGVPLTGTTATFSATNAKVQIQTSGSNNPVLTFFDTTGGGNGILTNGSNGSLGFFTTDTAGSYTATLATWNTAALTINGDLYAYNLHAYASASPTVWLQASGNAANKKYWKLLHDTGGSFHIQSLNDSFNVQGQFSYQRGPQSPIFTVYNFNAGGNGPTLEAQSNDSSSYAPANLSLWRSGSGGGAAPDSCAVGQIRFHGVNNVGYTEWGGIHVDLIGNNTTAGAPGQMSFWIDQGNADIQNFMQLEGQNKKISLFKPFAVNMNVNGAAYPGNFFNTNTGSSASSGISVNSGGRYFNIDAFYSASFVHEYGSGLPTRYTDYDQHNFRTVAGTQLLGLNGSAATFGTPVSFTSTGLFSDTITVNRNNGPILVASNLGNNFGYINLVNNGTNSIFAVEGSTAGTVWPGTAAFATLFGGTSPTTHFGTANVIRLTLGSTVATFTTPVYVPAVASSQSDQMVATTAFVKTAGATSQNASAKLSSPVAITVANAYVAGPNTGSIGANGEKWLITANCYFDTTTGAPDFMVGQIWNGSASVQTATVSCNGGQNVNCTITALVTLTAATTFTLRGTNASAGRGNLNADSHIVAFRVA